MKVSDLKKIDPLAEVFEFKPGVKYLIVVKVPRVSVEEASLFIEHLKSKGIDFPCIVVSGNNSVEFFENGKEPEQTGKGSPGPHPPQVG